MHCGNHSIHISKELYHPQPKKMYTCTELGPYKSSSQFSDKGHGRNGRYCGWTIHLNLSDWLLQYSIPSNLSEQVLQYSTFISFLQLNVNYIALQFFFFFPSLREHQSQGWDCPLQDIFGVANGPTSKHLGMDSKYPQVKDHIHLMYGKISFLGKLM